MTNSNLSYLHNFFTINITSDEDLHCLIFEIKELMGTKIQLAFHWYVTQSEIYHYIDGDLNEPMRMLDAAWICLAKSCYDSRYIKITDKITDKGNHIVIFKNRASLFEVPIHLNRFLIRYPVLEGVSEGAEIPP